MRKNFKNIWSKWRCHRGICQIQDLKNILAGNASKIMAARTLQELLTGSFTTIIWKPLISLRTVEEICLWHKKFIVILLWQAIAKIMITLKSPQLTMGPKLIAWKQQGLSKNRYRWWNRWLNNHKSINRGRRSIPVLRNSILSVIVLTSWRVKERKMASFTQKAEQNTTLSWKATRPWKNRLVTMTSQLSPRRLGV